MNITLVACLPVQLQGHLYVPYLPVKQLYAHQQSDKQKNSTITNRVYISTNKCQNGLRLSDLYSSIQ